MPLPVVDVSSPGRWSGTPTGTTAITSSSFTAPADSLLVVFVEADSFDDTFLLVVVDDGGLLWIKQVENEAAGSAGDPSGKGCSAIFTAHAPSAVSRTISVSRTAGEDGSERVSARCLVWTGVDVYGAPVDISTSANQGESTVNNLTTTPITPGANGVLCAVDTDWNALGVFEASADLIQDSADYAGVISVCDGYRACTAGVDTTANLNAAGSAAAEHKWCQVIVRAPVGSDIESYVAGPTWPMTQK